MYMLQAPQKSGYGREFLIILDIRQNMQEPEYEILPYLNEKLRRQL